MITVTTQKGVVSGIPLHNFIGCNRDKESQTWVVNWDGEKVYRQVVQDTVEELQLKVYIARHGKLPTKGILG